MFSLKTSVELIESPNQEELGRIMLNVHELKQIDNDDWLIDSGATDYFTNSLEKFVPGTMTLCKKGILTATNQVIYLTFKGDVIIHLLHPDGEYVEALMTDVLYVLDLAINLLGTIRLGKKDIGVNLLLNEVIFIDLVYRRTLGYGDVIDNQYFVRTARYGDLVIKNGSSEHPVTFHVDAHSLDEVEEVEFVEDFALLTAEEIELYSAAKEAFKSDSLNDSFSIKEELAVELADIALSALELTKCDCLSSWYCWAAK